MATRNLYTADHATVRKALREVHETLEWVTTAFRNVTPEERRAVKVVLKMVNLRETAYGKVS